MWQQPGKKIIKTKWQSTGLLYEHSGAGKTVAWKVGKQKMKNNNHLHLQSNSSISGTENDDNKLEKSLEQDNNQPAFCACTVVADWHYKQ